MAVQEAFAQYLKRKFEEDGLDYCAEMRASENSPSTDHPAQKTNQNHMFPASHHWCSLMIHPNQLKVLLLHSLQSTKEVTQFLFREGERLPKLWSAK